MGSELVRSSDGARLWPPTVHQLLTPQLWLEEMTWAKGGANPVVAGGLVKEFITIGRHWKQSPYYALASFLRRELGFGSRVVEFPYDWRAPLEESAASLASLLQSESASRRTKGVVLAHSMGGLVARWAIDELGASQYVCDYVTAGTPSTGAPEALITLLLGPHLPIGNSILRVYIELQNKLFRKKIDLRKFLEATPAMYYLLPTGSAVVDPDGGQVSIGQNLGWLRQEEYWRRAESFMAKLQSSKGLQPNRIVGSDQETCTRLLASKRGPAMWRSLRRDNTRLGDGVVPIQSADFGASTPPQMLGVKHGELYAHPFAKQWLATFFADFACNRRPQAPLVSEQVSLPSARLPDLVTPGQQLFTRINLSQTGLDLSGVAAVLLRQEDDGLNQFRDYEVTFQQGLNPPESQIEVVPVRGWRAVDLFFTVPPVSVDDAARDLVLRVEATYSDRSDGSARLAVSDSAFSVVVPEEIEMLLAGLDQANSLRADMAWLFRGLVRSRDNPLTRGRVQLGTWRRTIEDELVLTIEDEPVLAIEDESVAASEDEPVR
jgi:hypothetical protein